MNKQIELEIDKGKQLLYRIYGNTIHFLTKIDYKKLADANRKTSNTHLNYKFPGDIKRPLIK